MTGWGDERGQVVQVGAVLLFAILLIAFSTFQAVVVPQQNRQVEFDHSKRVQDQLGDARAAILDVPGGNTGESVAIPLGTTYPSRMFAINPGPPTGALRTVGTTDPGVNVSVANASTTGETGDFWAGNSHNYTTGGLVYRPNYNVYSDAPRTVYENTVLFNEFGTETVTLTGQQLVSDERINVVTLNGSLATTSASTAAVDLRATSTSTRTVSVTNVTAGSNVTVTLPTRLSASTWRDLLASEFTTRGGHVYAVDSEPLPGTAFRLVHVRLEPNVDYRLRMTRVGVGSDTDPTRAAYLTTVAGNDTAVPEGSAQRLVVETRDQFNNPVEGVRLNASVSTGTATPARGTSGDDGRLAFTYDAPVDIDGSDELVTVQVSPVLDPSSRPTFDRETPSNVTFTLRVDNTDESGTGGTAGPYTVDWRNPDDDPTNTGLRGCSADACNWTTTPGSSLDMLVDTGAVGAPVEFTVNDTSVATVTPRTNTTDADGSTETELQAAGAGAVNVFATSGGVGDRIRVRIALRNRLVENFEGERTLAANSNFTGSDSDVGIRADGDDSRGDISSSGTQAAYLENAGTHTLTSRVVDSSGFGQVYVEFDAKRGDDLDAPDEAGPEDLFAEYLDENDNWQVFRRVSATNSDTEEPYNNYQATLSSGDALHSDFRVRFRTTLDFDDPWYVDDVCVAETSAPCTFAGGSTPGFSSTSTTSILPYANSQIQQVSFTPGTDLAGSETVTIDLSDAQQTSPRQVEYGSAGASVVSGGGSAGFNTQNSNDARIIYNVPSGGVSAGSTVVVGITSILAGQPSDQPNPYSVSLTRSDGGTATTTFSTAFSDGTSELSSVSASDLQQDQNGQTQTLRFTPSTALGNGEKVSIDLSDAQDGSGNAATVNYQNGNPTVTSGSGSVQFTQQNTNDATLQYTAGAGGDGAGSTVEIEIGSVTTGDTSNFPPSTFTAGFSREDADTASATYEVTSSADTTAPDVDSVSATARSTDGNGGSGGNDAEEVEFSFGTSDNDAIDRVLLRVFDKSGNQIASRTVNSASSSSEVLSFPSQQMQGGGNYLDVNVTAFDASGNRRSCTTRLDSIGNTVDRGGFDCSSTRP